MPRCYSEAFKYIKQKTAFPDAMLKAFRQYGPGLMVPAAWTTAITAVSTQKMPENGLLIAHVIMAVLMALFLVSGRKEMNKGVLKAWKTVITLGLPLTAFGALGLTGVYTEVLTAFSLLGWMLLPGLALVYTGKKDETYGTGYTVSGLFSLLGLSVFLISMFYPLRQEVLSLSGLFLVFVGQSAGIFLAVHQNS
ncbi:hypothetical protein AQV86_04720 [Nanohaloarchaea archaeon SG9]|nr:hypothetical protein AQV86_04720 [Nanohaloarchaea archaeon SG9]